MVFNVLAWNCDDHVKNVSYLEDMVQAGRIAGLSEKECKAVISEVRDAVREWTRFAAEAEVKDEFVTKIGEQISNIPRCVRS